MSTAIFVALLCLVILWIPSYLKPKKHHSHYQPRSRGKFSKETKITWVIGPDMEAK